MKSDFWLRSRKYRELIRGRSNKMRFRFKMNEDKEFKEIESTPARSDIQKQILSKKPSGIELSAKKESGIIQSELS